jgi:hypothetical protein
MRPGTVLRLALAGTAADTMRVILTAISAALATLTLLSAATVLSITGGAPSDYDDSVPRLHYTNALLREPGLRPGVAIALCLLTIPIVGLAAQCARLGAPDRDRRLAALRLAGASPGQAVLVAAGETGFAALLGTALGLGTYLIGRRLADQPDPISGNRPLPTDVLPPAWALVLICVLVPLLAAGLATVTLRRVTISPFGVVRRVPRTAPRPWPGVLIVLGCAAFPLLTALSRARPRGLPYGVVLTIVMLGAIAALAGLILGTGWTTALSGRVLRRLTRRAAGLLAGARLTADPWVTARSYAALLLSLAFGAGIAVLAAQDEARQALSRQQEQLRAQLMGEPPQVTPPDPFYARAYELVYDVALVAILIAAAALLVAVVESIVTRRRTYASLVATGVPRGVLARSAVWQAIAPLLLAVPAAVGLGTLLPSLVFGRPTAYEYDLTSCVPPSGVQADCADPALREQLSRTTHIPTVRGDLPIPWHDLLLLAGGAFAIALLVTGIALLVLRPSTRAIELRTT